MVIVKLHLSVELVETNFKLINQSHVTGKKLISKNTSNFNLRQISSWKFRRWISTRWELWRFPAWSVWNIAPGKHPRTSRRLSQTRRSTGRSTTETPETPRRVHYTSTDNIRVIWVNRPLEQKNLMMQKQFHVKTQRSKTLFYERKKRADLTQFNQRFVTGVIIQWTQQGHRRRATEIPGKSYRFRRVAWWRYQ